MLSNAISKVEKFNAVQQLNATITPPSMVNMMSNNGDHCFQYQEQGYIARNCPNIRCFECHEYGHIGMECPHRIPPLGTPAKHHQYKPHNSHHVRSSSRHHHEDRDRQIVPGENHISIDTTAQVIMIHIEVIPGHNIGIIATTPGVAHNAHVLHTGVIAINLALTHHINHTADHLHTETHHHPTPETDIAHIHTHLTNPQDEIHIVHTHTPVDHEANHITRRAPK